MWGLLSGGLARRRSQGSVKSDTCRDRPGHERQDAGEEAEAEQAVFAQARQNRSESNEKSSRTDQGHDPCPACEDSGSKRQEASAHEKRSEAHR